MLRALFLAIACIVGTCCFAADSAIATLAEEIRKRRHEDMQAFVLLHQGKTLHKSFPDGFERRPPDIRSATKSITGLLVGIALDKGLLRSLDQRVIELLPEYADRLSADPRKSEMTLGDLLTMRSGLQCDDWNPDSPGHEDRMYQTRDWIAFWAATPMQDAPGAHFSYCTGNVIALGRILANVSGVPTARFAERELFEPLGIVKARWASWNRGTDTDSGGHLRIHPQDLAKIGLLVLAGGVHEGRQLVSDSWIKAMTTAHTDIPDRTQQYGYLWWIDRLRSPGLPTGRVWMAWGNGGNFLVVLPEQDAVVVFSGRRFNRADALEPLFWLRDRILPELSSMR